MSCLAHVFIFNIPTLWDMHVFHLYMGAHGTWDSLLLADLAWVTLQLLHILESS